MLSVIYASKQSLTLSKLVPAAFAKMELADLQKCWRFEGLSCGSAPG
jgi:hypothetical protein